MTIPGRLEEVRVAGGCNYSGLRHSGGLGAEGTDFLPEGAEGGVIRKSPIPTLGVRVGLVRWKNPVCGRGLLVWWVAQCLAGHPSSSCNFLELTMIFPYF